MKGFYVLHSALVSVSALLSGMNEFGMKHLNSLILYIAPYKEFLIDSLIVCEIWCLFKGLQYIEVNTENVTKICLCNKLCNML